MKVTNKAGLPEGLVRAISNDPYDSGDSDITASSLGDPPLLRTLLKRHADILEEDASDRIWSLLGQAAHVIAERGTNGTNVLAEKRLSMDVLGWKLSGAMDHFNLDGGILDDFKVTSAWTIVYGDRVESWEQQLNTLAHLLEHHGHKVTALEIIAILRDWSARDAERSEKYPKASVAVVPLKLWAAEKRQAYIEGRVRLHQAASRLDDDVITPCTEEERWMKRDKKTGAISFPRCEKYCAARPVCPVIRREAASL